MINIPIKFETRLRKENQGKLLDTTEKYTAIPCESLQFHKVSQKFQYFSSRLIWALSVFATVLRHKGTLGGG